MKFTVRPLTPDLWPALEDLFSKNGACNGCWCMYWRLGPAYFERPRENNRSALRKIVTQGPPPGLLAFDGEKAVGWCQLTPRDDLGWLNRKRAFERVDALPVWSISCFFIRRGYRRQGVMSELIAAALKAAKRAKAPALEAYPVDTARPGSTRNVFTGVASAFKRLGFKTVARREPTRPLMRHDLKGTRTRQCRTSVRGRDFDLVKGLPTALVITAENDYCVMKARLMPIRGKTSVNIRPNYWRKIEVDYEG